MLRGPEHHQIRLDRRGYKISGTTGKFTGAAAGKGPKLYVVAYRGKPIYVGVTSQRLSARFRLGWKATGENGYHGYAFRNVIDKADIAVWSLPDQGRGDARADRRDMETIEAEVVFAIRHRTGQWPMHQTEIHFWPSKAKHRRAAAAVLAQYALRIGEPAGRLAGQ